MDGRGGAGAAGGLPRTPGGAEREQQVFTKKCVFFNGLVSLLVRTGAQSLIPATGSPVPIPPETRVKIFQTRFLGL